MEEGEGRATHWPTGKAPKVMQLEGPQGQGGGDGPGEGKMAPPFSSSVDSA